MRSAQIAADIDAYIAAAPADVQPLLETMRATIAKAAPDATEAIACGMPTYRLHGNLVHFAAFTHHIGFYPGPDAITIHADALGRYATTSKGTIQFPLDRPLPVALITKIVQHRVQVSVTKASVKAAASSQPKSSARKRGRSSR